MMDATVGLGVIKYINSKNSNLPQMVRYTTGKNKAECFCCCSFYFLWRKKKDLGNSTSHKTIPCKQFKYAFSKETCEIRRIYSTNYRKIFNSKIHTSIHAQN